MYIQIFTIFISLLLFFIQIYMVSVPWLYYINQNIWHPMAHSTVQKYAKHTGYYSCTFYIYSRLPRLGTMNEMDTVYQESEGMVQY